MGLKADIKKADYLAKLRVYCPNCGHSTTMPVFLDKKICSHCGHIIYRTKEIEFKDKLNKARIKEKKK